MNKTCSRKCTRDARFACPSLHNTLDLGKYFGARHAREIMDERMSPRGLNTVFGPPWLMGFDRARCIYRRARRRQPNLRICSFTRTVGMPRRCDGDPFLPWEASGRSRAWREDLSIPRDLSVDYVGRIRDRARMQRVKAGRDRNAAIFWCYQNSDVMLLSYCTVKSNIRVAMFKLYMYQLELSWNQKLMLFSNILDRYIKNELISLIILRKLYKL